VEEGRRMKMREEEEEVRRRKGREEIEGVEG
jgi:hypothetical protein